MIRYGSSNWPGCKSVDNCISFAATCAAHGSTPVRKPMQFGANQWHEAIQSVPVALPPTPSSPVIWLV